MTTRLHAITTTTGLKWFLADSEVGSFPVARPPPSRPVTLMTLSSGPGLHFARAPVDQVRIIDSMRACAVRNHRTRSIKHS